MSLTKKSQALQTATAFVVISLLAVACGSESSKNQRTPSIDVEFHGPIVVPTPNVVPTPAPIPEPEVTPVPEVTPTPLVVPTPAPEAPVKHPLPAARDLTEAEKLHYLTNADTFVKLPFKNTGLLGLGFDAVTEEFKGDCMVPQENIQVISRDSRTVNEYAILPLSSTRQVKAALGFNDYPLYMSGRLGASSAKKLAVVAIAKKIRNVTIHESMVPTEVLKNMGEEACGQMYKKGEVRGAVTYSVIWIELNEKNSKEAILSRLIDSKTIGTFTDLQAFSQSLRNLASQLSDTDALPLVGSEYGSNTNAGQPLAFGFDFSSMLKAWSDATDQVELAKVPEVGSIFGSYPNHSTPAVTDGKSQ